MNCRVLSIPSPPGSNYYPRPPPRAVTWRYALLPTLSALLVLHYAAFVGWGDLLRPTLACEDDGDDGGGSRDPTPQAGLESMGLVSGRSLWWLPAEAVRSASHLVLSWLGVERVQAPALAALFLALGACIMQARLAGALPAAWVDCVSPVDYERPLPHPVPPGLDPINDHPPFLPTPIRSKPISGPSSRTKPGRHQRYGARRDDPPPPSRGLKAVSPTSRLPSSALPSLVGAIPRLSTLHLSTTPCHICARLSGFCARCAPRPAPRGPGGTGCASWLSSTPWMRSW